MLYIQQGEIRVCVCLCMHIHIYCYDILCLLGVIFRMFQVIAYVNFFCINIEEDDLWYMLRLKK